MANTPKKLKKVPRQTKKCLRDLEKQKLRRPGIEPGAKRWQRFILPLNHRRRFLVGGTELLQFMTAQVDVCLAVTSSFRSDGVQGQPTTRSWTVLTSCRSIWPGTWDQNERYSLSSIRTRLWKLGCKNGSSHTPTMPISPYNPPIHTLTSFM